MTQPLNAYRKAEPRSVPSPYASPDNPHVESPADDLSSWTCGKLDAHEEHDFIFDGKTERCIGRKTGFAR